MTECYEEIDGKKPTKESHSLKPVVGMTAVAAHTDEAGVVHLAIVGVLAVTYAEHQPARLRI